MNNLKTKHVFLIVLSLIAILVIAANPSFLDFNSTQFDTTGNKISLKSGLLGTNVVLLNITNNNLISTNVTIYDSLTVNTNVTINNNLTVQSNVTFRGKTTINTAIVTNAIFTNSVELGTNYPGGAGQFLETDGSTHLFWATLPALGGIDIAAGTNMVVDTNGSLRTISLGTNLPIVINTQTNNYLTVNSNATFTTSVTSNAFFTNIFVMEASWFTNQWVGPTNDVSFAATYQNFVASGDMEITGFQNSIATNANTSVLLLDPGGATRTLYFPAPWTNFTSDGNNAYVIPKTNTAIVTLFQYGNLYTNVVVRLFGPGTSPAAQVWSNYQGFIFPAGQPAPDTTPSKLTGPWIAVKTNGSIWLGPNVNQDTSFTGPALLFPYVMSMVDSNQPSDILSYLQVYDSENQFYGSSLTSQYHANKDAGWAFHTLTTVLTNGQLDTFLTQVDPSVAIGGTQITLSTNFTPVFTASKDGLVTANGFTDKSLAANGVVTNDSTGLLHTTPTLPSTLLPNDIAYTDKNNAWTSASSNYVASVTGYSTNSNNTTPDFAVTSESLLSTNANFTWLAPIHVDLSGKVYQFMVIDVTNSSGSPITQTLPANVHQCNAGAGLVITNFSKTFWEYWPPSGPTNFYHLPAY